ncbi:TauD-domain-containing protein [Xylariaceae sp. FL1272]|nr:TauD-domain-containing protein [Xylariaceae sp. FL1272]
MAPSATEVVTPTVEALKQKIVSYTAADGKESEPAPEALAPAVKPPSLEPLPELETSHREPLKLSGVLEQFKYFDKTPVIGREFVDVDLAEWLRAPNSDELLRDLAITISRRGVVFFRKQDNITNDLQKELVQRLGQLAGKPETSGLHIHPVINAGREHGGNDDEISVISSKGARKLYKSHLHQTRGGYNRVQTQRLQWHSDITFEPIPSDYSLLRLTELPVTGGDTLWASGYEVYDRISPTLQKFLDGLTAYYAQPMFNDTAASNGFGVFTGPRGAPENVGEVLEANHPVIRTNPVTGWKSVFAVGYHVKRILGLADAESEHFLKWFVNLIMENHDLQVRHHWDNVNDLAIWDNRSAYHAATPDYVEGGFGDRTGSRAVSLGEKPYFDPESTSRKEGLAKEGAVL